MRRVGPGPATDPWSTPAGPQPEVIAEGPVAKYAAQVDAARVSGEQCDAIQLCTCAICELFGSGGASAAPARVYIPDLHLRDGEEPVEYVHTRVALDRNSGSVLSSPLWREPALPAGSEFPFSICYDTPSNLLQVDEMDDPALALLSLGLLLINRGNPAFGAGHTSGFGQFQLRLDSVLIRTPGALRSGMETVEVIEGHENISAWLMQRISSLYCSDARPTDL